MKKFSLLSAAFFIVLGFSVNSYAQADQKKDEKSDTKQEVKENNSPADMEAFNSICAVSGEKVDKEITYTYEGKKYAFCCNNCLKKFKKDPAKYTSRLSEDGKSLKKSKS
jgi:YHS domain-containing protein